MKTDKNSWKGFFFFLLRLFMVVVVVIGLFFAYQSYKSKVLRNNVDYVYDYLQNLGIDVPSEYRFY